MMTPNEMWIALAVFRSGFKYIDWIKADNSSTQVTIPPYLKDLNAIRKAEDKLNKEQKVRYESALALILGVRLDTHDSIGEGELFKCIHASAAQRCEAMCRTLWPERFTE